MRLPRLLCGTGTLLLVGLTACQPDSPTAPPTEEPSLASTKKSRSYVISLADAAPGDVEARIEQAGGRLKRISKEAGVATVESDAPDFAAKVRAVPGIEGVGLDRMVRWLPDQRFQLAAHRASTAGGRGGSGTDELWFPIQWALPAIDAPKAWAKGALGKGARVAILDTGINSDHVDIAPHLDKARSRSFVPGQLYDTEVGLFWHATHVAGIVAGADNADDAGAIGVAPEATLISVKVLHGELGSFDWLISGIVYAATPINKGGAGADIINMSLGATFVPTEEDKELLKALDKATKYAHKQGVLVVASAGNGDEETGLGIDHDRTDFVTVPAQSAYVVGVSALGPKGFALGKTNFDRLASYSNFGRSLVDLSGPGGDFVLPGNDLCVMPINGGFVVEAPCWFFDMVISSCKIEFTDDVCFAAGTSMSAPTVSGVAALIVGKKGHMRPDDLLDALARSSDDLGRRGFDAVYGRGRVNAGRAISGGDDHGFASR